MTENGFRTFVDKYTDQYERVKRKLDENGNKEFRDGAIRMVGSENLKDGEKTDITGGDHKRTGTKEDRQVREARARKVSPEYRKQLEAYLRATSKGKSQ